MRNKIQVLPMPKVFPVWVNELSKYPDAIRVSMSDGKVIRYVMDVPQPAPVFRKPLDEYTKLCIGYERKHDE